MNSRPFFLLFLVALSSACTASTDEEETVEGPVDTTTQALTQTIPGYLYPASAAYPASGAYYFQSVLGGATCDNGQSAPSCLADKLDWRLMPQLTPSKIFELTKRIQDANSSSVAHASVIVMGQWNVVTVRDHRTPPRNYRRIDFQILEAYEANATGLHVATFYRLSGIESQRATRIASAHYLPFYAAIQFPCPVLANSYGVVSSGFVTGTTYPTDPPTLPIALEADRYFRKL